MKLPDTNTKCKAMVSSCSATPRITTNPRFMPMASKLTSSTPLSPVSHSPMEAAASTFFSHCLLRIKTHSSRPIHVHPPSSYSPSSRVFPPRCSLEEYISSPYTLGLVLDLGPETSWDGGEVGSPVVKRFVSDDEERWLMWYHGKPTIGAGEDDDGDEASIGLAISGNGIHWERSSANATDSESTGVVMGRTDNWWAFDTAGVSPSDVVIMSSNKVRAPGSMYWLYYTGFVSDKVAVPDHGRLPRSLPGLAMSQDGRHWARIEGDHHSGSLFDRGGEGDWDSLFVARPRVVYHGPGDVRMYYHSFDVESGRFAIGLARSIDGIEWTKLGKITVHGGGGFDEGGMMNGCVVRSRRDGSYLMAYEGVSGDGRRSIGLASSSDGLKEWRRCGDREVLGPSGGGGWDDASVGCPCLVEMDGEDGWRLYYRGSGGGGRRTGIGLAVSDGSRNASRYRRWGTFPL